MTAKLLAAPTDCCRKTKKSQFKMTQRRKKTKKTKIRKKEIIQNEIQTRQKKKQKIGGDKIQIGDARNVRTTDRKWLTNNRYPLLFFDLHKIPIGLSIVLYGTC